MKAFKNLIEFVTRHNKHFYNRDIKCPICGETMWFDDSRIENDFPGRKILRLVCKNNCCTMDIEYKYHILWDDEL
jgi:hypothetical protein